MLGKKGQTDLLSDYLNQSRQIFLYVILAIGFTTLLAISLYHLEQGMVVEVRHDFVKLTPFIVLLCYYLISRNLDRTADFMLIFYFTSLLPAYLGWGVTLSGAIFWVIYPSFVLFLVPFCKGRFYLLSYVLALFSLSLLQFLNIIDTGLTPNILMILSFAVLLSSLFTYFVSHRQDRVLSELNQQIFYDELTGYYNRKKLITDLENGSYKALILINTDNFKELNDFLGYRTGDKIIQAIGEVLNKKVSPKGIYRLSGSEFAILQFLNEGITEEEGRLIKLMKSILDEVSRINFREGKKRIPLSVSLGAAFDRDGVGSNLLSRCSLALHEGKMAKSKFCFYHPQFSTQSELKLSMSWDYQIERAFEDNRILPYYQPIFDNVTGDILKYECLVRLIDLNGAIQLPADFLPIVHKKHLYPRLTRTVFRHAVNAVKEKGIALSVNISEEDIHDPFTREYLILMLDEMEDGSFIQFEILETKEIENWSEVHQFLNEVRQYGCQIAIDDFGSGYSNFDYLVELKADYVKLDGNLIRELGSSREKRMLVENITSISRELGIKVVAEQVETKEVLEVVMALGIEYSQGFYLGAPVPFSSVSSSRRSASAPQE
ncbi:MAG: bifunctional diguanylate cyclase/phosphodiesterase [Spirochaetales bacterium]|nr:bifunctional diguanylate cyclase/phosphodiesterase [Spirochaetales bacterium]